MSNLRDMIKTLGDRFEQEDAAAYDLWSWLPSHKVAEKYHDDYASNFMPSIADIMREALDVIAEAQGHPMSEAERAMWNECPCGEDHEAPEEHT